MPTVETGRIVKRYDFWNPATWTIPSLYWDTFSQEQRIHAICRQLAKVIQYADYLGINTDDIASRLKAIEDGQLNDYIVAAIEDWFEENQPFIMEALENLQTGLSAVENMIPSTAFDSENTVKAYIDDAITTVTTDINGIAAIIPDSEFTAASTVKDAIDATNSDISDLAAIIPDSEFSAASTVKDAIDSVSSDLASRFPITTDEIANNAITRVKIADGSINNAKLSGKKLVVFGDSWGTNDNNTWCDDLASALDMTLVDYAEGGQGWSYGSNNIQTQIANATADDDVAIVIAIGGINDVRMNVSYNTYKTAIQTCCTNLRAKFNQARIFVIPINVPSKAHANTAQAIDAYYYNVFTDIALQSNIVAMVDINAWIQPLAPHGVWTGDNLHMNNYANNMFANFMYGTIQGSYLRSTRVFYPITASAGVTAYGNGIVIIDGICHMDIRGLNIPATNANETISIGQFGWYSNDTTPWYARRAVDDEYVPCISMQDGAYVGKLVINQNGSVTFTAAIGVSGNIAPVVHSWDVI